MKKKIITITGESGTGKTTLIEHVLKKYNINMIESYTDRAKRTPNEVGHTFLTKKEYDDIKLEDMIAHTNFGGNRYCCIKDDVKDLNTYVIDESGIIYLQSNFGDKYDIVTIRLLRDKKKREEIVGATRINRDIGQFNIPLSAYDYEITNNGDIKDFYNNIDKVIEHILMD